MIKIIQNTNQLASYADQKALIDRLFEAGYRADKNEIKNIAEPQVQKGSGAKFTQGECIPYHELKLEVFR